MPIFLVIIFLPVLILIHELGHFLAAKFFKVRVDEFGFGFPPRLLGKKIGETTYTLNLLPFGGFVKIYGEDGLALEKAESGEKKRGFAGKPVWQKIAIVLAGVFMNVILGWFLLGIVLSVGLPERLIIADVAENSPAFSAGLKPGDIIEKAVVFGIILENPIPVQQFVQLVNAHPGEETALSILRGKTKIETALFIRSQVPDGEGPIGVSLTETGIPKEPFPLGFLKSIEITSVNLELIAKSFFRLITGIFVQPSIVKNVSGPVGIISIAHQAGELGILYFFQFAALISLNLVVLNLMPFPALDGGRALVLVFEKIKGRPISHKIQGIVNTAGFALLILLMVAVTVKDIGNLVK